MRGSTWLGRIGIAVADAACRQWREPWLMARASREGLDIPLLPSPLLRRCSRWLLLALLVHVAVLVWTQHPWSALFTTAVAASAWLRRQPGRPPAVARQLLLNADGRIHLLMSSGDLQAVQVHPSSMRLGSWMLLRLVTPRGRQSVLLGPDNVEPAVLAALRRRLTSGAALQHEKGADPGQAAPVRYTPAHTSR